MAIWQPKTPFSQILSNMSNQDLTLTVQGWVKSIDLTHPHELFIELSDGSCEQTLRLHFPDREMENIDDVLTCGGPGARMQVVGTWSDNKFKVEEVCYVGKVEEPVSPEEFKCIVVHRISTRLVVSIHEFFTGHGFQYNQKYDEYDQLFGILNTYTLRPMGHYESWTIKAEIAFSNIKDIKNLVQDFVKFVIESCLDNSRDDLNALEANPERLSQIIEKDFAHITYTEAIDILATHSKLHDGQGWGIALDRDQQDFLCDIIEGPVCVTHFPKDTRSCNMKVENPGAPPGEQTVRDLDLLIPSVGRLASGGEFTRTVDAAFQIRFETLLMFLLL